MVVRAAPAAAVPSRAAFRSTDSAAFFGARRFFLEYFRRRAADTDPSLHVGLSKEKAAMRSNSGKDEARNNMHDPTMRNPKLGHGNGALKETRPKAPSDPREGRKD